MWIIGMIVFTLVGYHVGCIRVGARMKQVAYLKEYDARLSHATPDHKRWFAEGMRYVVTEVTHDDFYYEGEQRF